jgi:hypothetical protein
MFQPLPSRHTGSRSPFLISAYGVENTFTANDVLRRWLFIFEGCLEKRTRIIGFSTGNILFISLSALLININN